MDKKRIIMYRDDYRKGYSHENRERSDSEVYTKQVKAGKRSYFFDVKATRENNDFYLTITESKRRVERDGSFSYDKHKIFLYKEDFVKFTEGLEDVIGYIKHNCLHDEPIEERHFESRSDEDQTEEPRSTDESIF